MSPVQQSVLAAGEASEHRPLIISLFAVFVVATLGITVWAGRQTKSAADFYAGGRQFSAFQNGLAVSGDYMSAASFLGIAGAIALFGYDGFLYSIGFLVAWLVALLLVAEPLRNSGRYTMGDVLAYRMRQRPVRTAAGTSTIVVSIFYLLAQMAGAGVLVSLLLGITSDAGKVAIVALVGVLMILYVTIGGMKGTTWVQMVKAVLLISGTILITFLVLLKFNFNISDLLGTAAETQRQGRRVPGARPQVRRHRHLQAGLHLAGHRPGPRHRRSAAHPDPLLHGAHGQGRPEVRELGDRHHRRLLPDDDRARLRRRRADRPERDHRLQPSRATRPHHCSPCTSAASTRPGARYCSRRSRRSPSRRSSPSSPDSRWPRRRPSRTTSTPTSSARGRPPRRRR